MPSCQIDFRFEITNAEEINKIAAEHSNVLLMIKQPAQ